jgi:hypothetical protein
MDSVFIEISLVVVFVSRQGSSGREGIAPHDRVIVQAFVDSDFSAVFSQYGLDEKAEAGAHRPETYRVGVSCFHDDLPVLGEIESKGREDGVASASTGRAARDVVTRRIFGEFVKLFNSMFLALAAPCARTFREPAGATRLEMQTSCRVQADR